MPSEDLKQYATSDTDFYALLGVSFETSQKDIDRAWRKTALKYHPDKVGNDPVAKDKFHLAQIGYDLLSDPSSKAIYDNARTARLQRKRQNELLEGRRRQMKDDLEMRERRGVKRSWDEDSGTAGAEEEILEREIRRLAEDGKRRRKEREEALRREMMERDGLEKDDAETAAGDPPSQTQRDKGAITATSPLRGVAEIDRTIKVRWPVEEDGDLETSSSSSSITANRVKEIFSKFGKIENADLLSPKMLRLSGSSSSSNNSKKKNKKQLAAVCMVQYASVVGAHAAVEDFPKLQPEPPWSIFDSVLWASNQQPDFLSNNSGQEPTEENWKENPSKTDTSPPTSAAFTTTTNGHTNGHTKPTTNPFASLKENMNSANNPPQSPRQTTNNNLSTGTGTSTKPSFTSFSSSRLPKPSSSSSSSSFGNSTDLTSQMTLEEITLIRLKEAEKRRLRAEIERRDREEDATTATAADAAAAVKQ